MVEEVGESIHARPVTSPEVKDLKRSTISGDRARARGVISLAGRT